MSEREREQSSDSAVARASAIIIAIWQKTSIAAEAAAAESTRPDHGTNICSLLGPNLLLQGPQIRRQRRRPLPTDNLQGSRRRRQSGQPASDVVGLVLAVLLLHDSWPTFGSLLKSLFLLPLPLLLLLLHRPYPT